jgi:hypothetical protein
LKYLETYFQPRHLEVGMDKKEWMSTALNAQMARADQLIAAAAHGSGTCF